MPARHYRFERQIVGMTIGFFGIDTVALEQPFAGYANGLSWLEAALSASTADLRIVFGHAPIWASPGRYGDNAKLEAALAPVLYEHDVAIYLAGHEHHLELQRPRDGLTQVISGAGATNRDVDPGENTRFASSRAGFFVFEIDEDDVRVQAISRDGELLEAQEEFVGVRAFLEADDGAQFRQHLSVRRIGVAFDGRVDPVDLERF